MKISVSMYSLVSTIMKEKWTVIDFIQYAKDINLEGVELLDIFWQEGKQEEELAEVLYALKQNDLRVSAYDVSNNFVKKSSSERDMEASKVIEAIRIAKKLGTDIVRVFSGDLQGDISYEEAQSWIISELKKCAEVAEKEKVYLAIENHGMLAGKSKQVKEIIEKVNNPYVKSTFDTGNFLLLNENPSEAFDHLKDEIVHVHFKDFREKEKDENVEGLRSIDGRELIGTIPGNGESDLAYIVKGLQKNKYKGWLSVEFEGPEEPKMATKEAVGNLRNLIK